MYDFPCYRYPRRVCQWDVLNLFPVTPEASPLLALIGLRPVPVHALGSDALIVPPVENVDPLLLHDDQLRGERWQQVLTRCLLWAVEAA